MLFALAFVMGVAVGASGYRLIQVWGHQDSVAWESFVAIIVPLLSAIVGGLITTIVGKKMRDRSDAAK